MKHRIAILLVVFGAVAAFAVSPIQKMLYMPVLAQVEQSETEEFPTGDNELFDSGVHKNIKSSFLLSLAVPGAGEFYAGNPIKAGAFFAAEAALWTGVIIYNNKGNDGEQSYRDFADAHWEFDYYYDWFIGFGDATIYTEQLPVNMVIDGSDTTYTPDKTHDYYEMIGKYDWFVLGWEDLSNRDAIRDSSTMQSEVDKILGVLKAHEDDSNLRLEYMNMRKETNDYFTWSKYFIGAAIFNHFLSAFDAAWTAKRSNDKLYEGFTFAPHIEAQMGFTASGEPEPRIAINLANF
ncbi:hypothetical protein KAH81_04360 [bacterium]|nr:hypothetical protein [bacterium]